MAQNDSGRSRDFLAADTNVGVAQKLGSQEYWVRRNVGVAQKGLAIRLKATIEKTDIMDKYNE
ncbi:MAG TPA: hypothetical protein VGQ12_05975 [Candidatus Angelobacter sp.]|jgi:hypothetical protein|nr:hypothetical protein [Candidatus Angelobacter sp.]